MTRVVQHLERPLFLRNAIFPSTQNQYSLSSSKNDAYIIAHVAFSSAAKCLNRKYFVLLHLRLVIASDNGNALAAVDAMLVNVVAVQVANTFDWKRMTIYFNFVALHCFLDYRADVSNAYVDSSFLSSFSLLSRPVYKHYISLECRCSSHP